MFKNKCYTIVLSLLITTLLSSCSSVNNINLIKTDMSNYNVEVKGLSLKYILIDSAYEIYEVKILKIFPESYYKSDEATYQHYLWLCDTYNNLDPKMKDLLVTVNEVVHPWHIMNVTTKLDDNSTVSEIINQINTSTEIKLSEEEQIAFQEFYTYYYENFLASYLESNRETFDNYANKINESIRDDNPNIIEIMENVSGISFSKSYKSIMYYTLRPVGAMGFRNDDVKISTIQRTKIDYYRLFSTVFHEFSHELFQTFTRNNDFIEVSEILKVTDKEFERIWLEKGYDRSYNWIGWCEENLVEGFAHYLDYKYYNYDQAKPTYVYDLEFYNYLKDTNFDPDVITLKDASINFIKEIIDNIEK